MKFAVVGGDVRSVFLCELLMRDGHRVCTYALEHAELPSAAPRAGCLQGCVYGVDCVVLPVPSELGDYINAPFAAEKLRSTELVTALWSGQLLFGGRLGRELCYSAINAGLRVSDVMSDPAFACGNAALTAEAAVYELIGSGPGSICSSHILITGWGRIAKLLALRLRALGACVSVAARSAADRAMISALGLNCCDFPALEYLTGSSDYIVNTVPARVIAEEALCCAESGTVLLELASPPGGFDRTLAQNIGLKCIAAPGLPGKYSPRAAAALIRDAIYRAVEEQED